MTEQEQSYAYLLGMYLGDGYIVKVSRTYALRICLDAKYPGIIERVAEKMRICYPHNTVNFVHKLYKGNPSCVEVLVYNNKTPQHFPQSGDGKKT